MIAGQLHAIVQQLALRSLVLGARGRIRRTIRLQQSEVATVVREPQRGGMMESAVRRRAVEVSGQKSRVIHLARWRVVAARESAGAEQPPTQVAGRALDLRGG